PYFNALLYRVFGTHLAVLHASGAVCGTLILAMCYWLARQVMNEWEAGVATALIILRCAFNAGGSYIQPYFYSALYGFFFALCVLVCAIRYMQRGDSRWLLLAGISAGMVIICKPEFGALAVATIGAAWLLVCLRERRTLWGAALMAAFPMVAISSI